jgi:predicted dehydrogenase
LGASAIARDKVLPALLKTENARAQRLGTRDPAGRAPVAEAFGVREGTASLDAVVAAADVDAVYVSLPNTLHCEWIIKALEAGKPVLCDKPMCVTPEEAAAVADKSRATGLPVVEGFMFRFHPQHRHIRQRLQDGSVGAVREARAFFHFGMLEAVGPSDIRLTDGPGAGALMDMGCYTVAAVRMALGEPVAANGWQVRHPRLGVNIGGAANLLFPEGRRAQISWAYDAGNGGGFQVIGTQAILETGNPFVPGQGNPGETTVRELRPQGQMGARSFEAVDQFQLEFEDFAAAVLEGRQPLYTVDDAVAQAKAMALVQALPDIESQRSGEQP